jgi:dienelactone hydrolase
LTTAAVLAVSAGGATRVDSCAHSLAGAKISKLLPHTLREVDLVTAGRGPRAVLLSNQSDESLCSWLTLARPLVQAGFRVGLYDYSGLGAVADATVAARELRRQGATRIGLVGASEGAKVSIAAATPTGAAAVVSLSAERYLDAYGDVLPAARRLRAPVLYLYGKGDPLADENTPQLYRATREHDKQLVGLPGWGHGTALLAHPSVRTRIVAFMREHLSPRRRAAVAAIPPPPLAHRCRTKVTARTFWFQAADGATLDGAVLGTGRTGVVLATEYPADLCRWVPEAIALTERGLRVLLFDFRGLGLSPPPSRIGSGSDYVPDVVGAARKLRVLGVSRVYLMGASLGGTSSIVAAARIKPGVAGVVSLSGEADLSGLFPDSGLDAVAAAKRLKLPVLFVAAKQDALVPPADVARMRGALRSQGSKVVVYPGAFHGWDLLYLAPYRAKVAALVNRFVR